MSYIGIAPLPLKARLATKKRQVLRRLKNFWKWFALPLQSQTIKPTKVQLSSSTTQTEPENIHIDLFNMNHRSVCALILTWAAQPTDDMLYLEASDTGQRLFMFLGVLYTTYMKKYVATNSSIHQKIKTRLYLIIHTNNTQKTTSYRHFFAKYLRTQPDHIIITK